MLGNETTVLEFTGFVTQLTAKFFKKLSSTLPLSFLKIGVDAWKHAHIKASWDEATQDQSCRHGFGTAHYAGLSCGTLFIFARYLSGNIICLVIIVICFDWLLEAFFTIKKGHQKLSMSKFSEKDRSNMSTKVCINCKVNQPNLAFVVKGTGLTEVDFVCLRRTLMSLDNQLALVLGQSTNCCEPKPTCVHSVILSDGRSL